MSATFILKDASENTLSLSDQTVWLPGGTGRRLAEYQFPACNGVEWKDLGDGVQEGKLSGRLHAANGGALATAMAGLDAWRDRAFTLQIRVEGETPEDEWDNCVFWGAVQFGRRTPPQADGSVSVPYTVTMRRSALTPEA